MWSLMLTFHSDQRGILFLLNKKGNGLCQPSQLQGLQLRLCALLTFVYFILQSGSCIWLGKIIQRDR